MPEDNGQETEVQYGSDTLEKMHSLLLEALRHREQDILKYLIILGSSIGGFFWLLDTSAANIATKVSVTVIIELILLLGAVYSLTLGYNYRYITLELAKLEAFLDVTDKMLVGWPKYPKDFLERYKLWNCIPWCTPPDMIKIFWIAFQIGIVVVTISSAFAFKLQAGGLWIVILSGVMCFIVGLVMPWRFGSKLIEKAEKERDYGDWPNLPDNQQSSQIEKKEPLKQLVCYLLKAIREFCR